MHRHFLKIKTITKFCRPFWIRWYKTSVYIGRGLAVGEGQIYSTATVVDFDVNALSISTTSANEGVWHFHIGMSFSVNISNGLN